MLGRTTRTRETVKTPIDQAKVKLATEDVVKRFLTFMEARVYSRVI